MILLNGLIMIVRMVVLSYDDNSEIIIAYLETYVFSAFYVLEACLKLFGLGLRKYWTNGWNVFDFSVTALSLLGLALGTSGQDSVLCEAIHLRYRSSPSREYQCH